MAGTVMLESVIETVTNLVAKELGDASSKIDPGTDLTSQGADSVKVLRVVAMIERMYDIELDDEDVFAFRTIRDVSDAVLLALGEKENVQ